MAPAEQIDVSNDDHDSGLDGGSGGSDTADFGLYGGAPAAVDDNLGDFFDDLDWVARSRYTGVAEFPENGLSAGNLAAIDQTAPRPSTLGVRIREGRRQFFVRLRGDRGQSSEQRDTPQDGLARGSEQPVLRLRGDRSQKSEQQDIPQDDLAHRGEQPVLRLRGPSSRIRERQDAPQDGLARDSEQQGVASQDDPSQNNSATDAASDAGQDESPLLDFLHDTGA